MRALVMELVEGPTIAERIGQGPVPLDEALPIARQSSARHKCRRNGPCVRCRGRRPALPRQRCER